MVSHGTTPPRFDDSIPAKYSPGHALLGGDPIIRSLVKKYKKYKKKGASLLVALLQA